MNYSSSPTLNKAEALVFNYLTKELKNRGTNLLVILGPTGVGKTALSLQLAQQFAGEIVSLDSRQVYQSCDIGTAKPSAAERSLVPHHLLDLADPKAEFNLAHYLAAARAAIIDIGQRGKLPLLVGGSVLHIDALLNSYNLAELPPQTDLRQQLYDRIATEGPEALHQQLQELDPAAAAKIHPHNRPRLIRALEVCLTTQAKFSKLQKQQADQATPIYLGLIRPRAELYQRINQRVDAMMAAGFVAEVKNLLATGVPPTARSMTGHGYRHIYQYLQGQSSLATTIATIKRDTRHYAKRQLTWWRRNPAIAWFDLSKV